MSTQMEFHGEGQFKAEIPKDFDPKQMIADAVDKLEEEIQLPRSFPGILMVDHKFTDDPAVKYERAHEKRRLKAYLKGHQRFQHGWQPAYPIGRRPIMFPMYEGPKNDQPTTTEVR